MIAEAAVAATFWRAARTKVAARDVYLNLVVTGQVEHCGGVGARVRFDEAELAGIDLAVDGAADQVGEELCQGCHGVPPERCDADTLITLSATEVKALVFIPRVLPLAGSSEYKHIQRPMSVLHRTPHLLICRFSFIKCHYDLYRVEVSYFCRLRWIPQSAYPLLSKARLLPSRCGLLGIVQTTGVLPSDESMIVIKVLLVEEHKSYREALELALECDSGFLVVGVTADAEQALQLSQVRRPDVVLVCECAAERDSYALVRQLCAQPAPIPVIVLVENYVTDVQDAFAAGAAACIPKWSRLEQLCATVRAVARRNKGRSADPNCAT